MTVVGTAGLRRKKPLVDSIIAAYSDGRQRLLMETSRAGYAVNGEV